MTGGRLNSPRAAASNGLTPRTSSVHQPPQGMAVAASAGLTPPGVRCNGSPPMSPLAGNHRRSGASRTPFKALRRGDIRVIWPIIASRIRIDPPAANAGTSGFRLADYQRSSGTSVSGSQRTASGDTRQSPQRLDFPARWRHTPRSRTEDGCERARSGPLSYKLDITEASFPEDG